MEIENILKAWVSKNRNNLKKADFLNTAEGLEMHLVPNNEFACELIIRFSKNQQIADICVGKNFGLSDFKIKSVDQLQEILEAAKNGKVTDNIQKLFGKIALVESRLTLDSGDLYAKAYSPLKALTLFLKPVLSIQKYESW